MQDRIDLYAPIHKAYRAFMCDTLLRVGRVDVDDPVEFDDSCGRVTTLGFVATGKASSSNNRGQLHRTKTKDFRKDDFHSGGKANVDRIDPYTIGVTWDAKPPKSDLYESARDLWRLQPLRRWSHEQVEQVLT